MFPNPNHAYTRLFISPCQIQSSNTLGALSAIIMAPFLCMDCSLQVTRKDLLLGKVDLALETFGDVFRAPDDGNRYLPVSRPSAVAADRASSSALAFGAAEKSQHRLNGSNSNNSKGASTEISGKSATRKSSLSTRTGLDFWVPMTAAGVHGTIAHAGELRLRVLMLPIPSTHRLALQYSWLVAPLPLTDDSGRARGSSSSSGSTPSSVPVSSAVKVVECRDESAEDRRTLYKFLLARLARARRARASAAASSQHRIAATDDDGMEGGPYCNFDDSGDEGDHDDGSHTNNGGGSIGGNTAQGRGGKDGANGSSAATLSGTFEKASERDPPVSMSKHGNRSAATVTESRAMAVGARSGGARTNNGANGRSRRRQRQRQGLLTLRVEERWVNFTCMAFERTSERL